MTERNEQLRPIAAALEDHSAEGIAILTAEPARLIHATLLVIGSLVLVALVWSFVGRIDVIVAMPGVLEPEAEVRRFYAPIDGELVDIYVAEGQPVAQGDVIARLNARGAIEAAAQALDAQIQLAAAERNHREFPDRKARLQRQAEAIESQLEVEEQLHEKRVSQGMTKLAEAQRAKLEEARGNLLKAARELQIASADLDRFERLFRLPGGGGISKDMIEERKSTLINAETSHRLAEARLGQLDFQLSEEYSTAKAELEGSNQKLKELRIQYETAQENIEQEEYKVTTELKRARLAAEVASRITFDNIDEENLLRIVAPVSGVITELAFDQPGDKVLANNPMGGIAPTDAQPVLEIEIAEQDRGFLNEGLPAKLKFSAFPHQRYGFIEGQLDYISPTTQRSVRGKETVYKGRVTLDKHYIAVADRHYPLRYGMTATAEIVVRKRRVIDLVLDPFRQVTG